MRTYALDAPGRAVPAGAGGRARPPAATPHHAGAGPAQAAASRFAHDFSRVPVSRSPLRIQRLVVSAPADAAEREAERAADQLPGFPVERRDPAPARLQAKAASSGGAAAAQAPPAVHRVLASPGQPLETGVRGFMERRLGHDFSRVRVHADAHAAQSVRAVNAEAYTVGQHVVFDAGRYAPDTVGGARLLAHELAHTVQQGAQPAAVQRAMKFEFQTDNRVWAVKNTGAPRPVLLPRKYAPATGGYAPGAGEERGDRPAYLSTGPSGGPARRKGDVVFVEAEGPMVTREARGGSIDPALDAQIVREYRFRKQVKVDDLVGKPVKAGQLSLASETDHADDPSMSGAFNPSTFELRYLNADDTPVDVHLDEARRFQRGHVKLMQTRRSQRTDIDRSLPAQHVETWKITPDSSGPLTFRGGRVRLAKVSTVDHGRDRAMRGKFNKGKWEKSYFMDSDFTGDVLSPTATRLDVHVDEDGRLRDGRVRFMEKKKLPADTEQTAIELQSETGGVLEFETPKWFRDWPELEERIQDAVDMTGAISAQVGTPREVTDAAVVDPIAAATTGAMGHVVEWPAAFSTAHLKKLVADKRRLLVQIVDPAWEATIQASEGIALSEYGSLMREHEFASITTVIFPGADSVFATAFAAAKLKDPTLDESRFANLKGFLQLVMSYILRGQIMDLRGDPVKAGFRLMARTNFGSMYRNLLSKEEQALFTAMVNARANPLLTPLQPLVDTRRTAMGLDAIVLGRSTRFFAFKAGSNPRKATFGPRLHDWLAGITKGKDLLATGLSDAMGEKSVQTKPGTKDYRHAQFEVRGTVAHGGNVHPASRWVAFARVLFEAAMGRSRDTPDDPSTPRVNESSRTGLRD